MKRYAPLLVLILIVVLGFGIRLFRLDSAPKGALIDEAHFGYLAYSLLETGQDEHGVSWPIIFKGFGDQKLPAYAYALLPVVKLIGLSTLAIRIPSLLAGTALIAIMYALVRELGLPRRAGLLAAFLTAVSPWPFFLSRIGFESNLALFFFGLGLWSLGKAFNQKKLTVQHKWLVGSGILMGLTWYAYVAYRPLVVGLPLLWFGWLIWQQQIKWQTAARFFVALAITVAPLFLPSAVGSNSTRLKQVGIFSDGDVIREVDEKRRYCSFHLHRYVCFGIWNKVTVVTYVLAERYFTAFSPQYLATAGEDGLEFLTVERNGQFAFFVYPLFILGWLGLASKEKNLNIKVAFKVLIVLGVLLMPVPALIAGEAQKVRISAWFPFVLILMVFGSEVLYSWVKPRYNWLVSVILVGGISVAALFYFVAYFTVHVVKYDYTYQSYLPDLYKYLEKYDRNVDIYIKPFYSDPLMFYAYYAKLDPKFYQENAVLGELEASGFQHTIGLANYHVIDESGLNLMCDTAQTGRETIFVNNVAEPQLDAEHVVYSVSGVMSQVYVYNLTANKANHPELCANRTPNAQ